MKPREPITSVMTADPSTVDVSQPLSEVYQLFRDAPFHHLPVMEGDKPVGMVSATDVLRLVYDIESADDRMLSVMLDHQFNIEDAMTTDLRSLPLSASVRDAAESLADGRAHSVLVVDDAGVLAGIVTTTDLVRLLATM